MKRTAGIAGHGPVGPLVMAVLACWSLAGTDALAQAIDTAEIFRNAGPAVVLIVALDEHGQPLSLGSGFFVDDKGTVASNFHVLEGATSARIKAPGTSEAVPVQGLVGSDPELDLALLKVQQSTPRFLSVTQAAEPTIGQRIVTIGNPMGLEGTISEGVVSGVRKLDEDVEILQITAPISPGSSGGPVLDAQGRVIGVATASLTAGQNLNFAVPARYLSRLMRQPQQLRELKAATGGAPPAKFRPEGSEAVRVVDHFIDGAPAVYASIGRGARLSFSIHNETDYGIRHVRLLASFHAQGVDRPVHFLPILVEKTIPAGLSVRAEARDPTLARHGHGIYDEEGRWTAIFRVLDYEIERKPSAGALDFVPAK